MIRKFILTSAVMLMLVGMTLGQSTTAKADMICTRKHVVRWGDTLYSLARYYGTTVGKIQSINGMEANTRIYVGQTLCIKLEGTPRTPTPTPSNVTYVVQYGDTIASIARRFHMDWRQLAAANNLYNPNRIYVGQMLIIPQFAT